MLATTRESPKLDEITVGKWKFRSGRGTAARTRLSKADLSGFGRLPESVTEHGKLNKASPS